MIALYIILGIVAGACITWLATATLRRRKIVLDIQTKTENDLLLKTKEELNNQCDTARVNLGKLEESLRQATDSYNKLSSATAEIEQVFSKLSINKQELDKQIAVNEAKISHATELYQEREEKLNSLFEQYAEKQSQQSEQWREEAIQSYKEVLKDQALASSIIGDQIQKAQQQLNDLRRSVQAAIEERKRAAAESDKQNFYRMVLSERDLAEIYEIRKIIPILRNAEPINKVIWKCYYEKPCNAMIGRILGDLPHTGIYKITNLVNGMCYVGQSIDIASRFKQHIKRGLGAETPTQNKLYPAMAEFGPENFTFEMIEECPGSQLNEREDFWQDYFQARTFGYSIK